MTDLMLIALWATLNVAVLAVVLFFGLRHPSLFLVAANLVWVLLLIPFSSGLWDD
jgi:hypothetical protein